MKRIYDWPGVQAPVQGRKHFFALSAKLMRQILVDRSRRHAASKRGGDVKIEPLDDQSHGVSAGIEEFLILDQALTRLAEAEPRLARVIELHYFGGLNGPEIAELLGNTGLVRAARPPTGGGMAPAGAF